MNSVLAKQNPLKVHLSAPSLQSLAQKIPRIPICYIICPEIQPINKNMYNEDTQF